MPAGLADGSKEGPHLVAYWPGDMPKEHVDGHSNMPDIIQEAGPFVGLASSHSSSTNSDGEGPHHGTMCLMESHSSEPVSGTQSVQLGCVRFFLVGVMASSTTLRMFEVASTCLQKRRN